MDQKQETRKSSHLGFETSHLQDLHLWMTTQEAAEYSGAGDIAAARALARERLAGGQPRAALAAVRRILEVDPWHEAAVLVGMKACLALDDRAGALRLYRDLEQALRQDLDLTPQAELRQLYQTLCQA